MHRLLITSLLLFTGCSPFSKGGADNLVDSGTAAGGGASGDTDSSTDPDDTAVTAAVWWRLVAHLTLLDGLPTPESTLSVIPLDADGLALCTPKVADTVVQATAEESPHETILSWWRLSLDTTTLCDGTPSPLGVQVLLGVGAPHPDVQAAMQGMAELDASLPLNGAFLSRTTPDDELFVFGVAGPEAAYQGTGLVAEDAPLADGVWRIQSVYWFSL